MKVCVVHNYMALPPQLLTLFQDLAIQNYSAAAIQNFLKTNPIASLLSQALKADLGDERNFQGRISLQRLLAIPEIFGQLLSDPEAHVIIDGFVTSPSEDHREFIAEAINENVEIALKILSENSGNPTSPIVQGYLMIIFHLLRDPESQVGLKTAKFLVRLTKGMQTDTTRDYLFDSELAQKLIKGLLTCEEAVVEIRIFEALVQAGNYSPRLFTLFERLGILQ